MLMIETIVVVGTAIAMFFFTLAMVESYFEKKEDARRAQQKAFAKQVRAWCENPHDASLRWW
jgi:hypothetical protein